MRIQIEFELLKDNFSKTCLGGRDGEWRNVQQVQTPRGVFPINGRHGYYQHILSLLPPRG